MPFLNASPSNLLSFIVISLLNPIDPTLIVPINLGQDGKNGAIKKESEATYCDQRCIAISDSKVDTGIFIHNII